MSTENSILGGQARIIFTSQAGTLFDGLDTVPEPPAQGDYDSAVVQFVSLASDATGGNLTGMVVASGTISLIDAGGAPEAEDAGDIDPYQQCSEQTRNHGEYVSCAAHVSNVLRADGQISGREKGQHQRQVAKQK